MSVILKKIFNHKKKPAGLSLSIFQVPRTNNLALMKVLILKSGIFVQSRTKIAFGDLFRHLEGTFVLLLLILPLNSYFKCFKFRFFLENHPKDSFMMLLGIIFRQGVWTTSTIKIILKNCQFMITL